MSATSTPSLSSGQTRYYDAVVMHFSLHTDNTADEGQQGSTTDLHLQEASGGLSNASHPYQVEEVTSPSSHTDEVGQKNPSIRSLPTVSAAKVVDDGNNALARKASARTAGSTRASAFANGAPLMGPNAEPPVDQGWLDRGTTAEQSLNQKQKDRITKEERRESKKFSKLLRTESTTEKVALDSALKSLSSLQSLHKTAIRREAKAEASYAKALSAAQEAEGRFQEERARATEMRARVEARCIQERARWEGEEGKVQAQQERLDSARETVKDTEMRIAECAREVERLRIVKATDEREREAKLTEMTGQK